MQRLIALPGCRVKAHLCESQALRALILNLADEDGFHVQTKGTMEAVQARGEGVSEALLREKVLRLGNDPLEIVEMNVDLAEGLHLPVSELNRVRRQLVHQWQEARLEPRKRALEAVR